MKDKEDIYAKWINGEISDAELEAVEGREAIEELKQVTQEVDKWSMPAYNIDGGYKKLSSKLQEDSTSKQPSKWPRLLAFACLIGMLIFGLVWYLSSKSEVLEAKPGQQLNFAFQDDSEVWLNSGSIIEYKSADWSTERTLELQGEAMFEVSKGSPFKVNTVNGSVTVLGTQFNVRAWGENLHVECYEGKVQVQKGNQVTILTANESVSIIAGFMNEKQAMNNSGPSWRNGMSRFFNDKLQIVCHELERQFQVKIELKAADRNFSGNFKHNDLDEALRSICKPLGLSYTISEDKKSVVIE